ncbi:ABC transporter ATP-binding protein [Butyricimonas hominis]|uniref:ABC transporter ATP-binding protein n=1 Tax=Butyricimonas TaxID=574697 RepID=UPI0035172347
MKDSIVKVEHLSHRYNIQWAIQDINFEIKEKGVLGLLGSNGAGKSTTMNIICGVLNQTEGEVYLNGYSLREKPIEAKRHIGFLPQKPPLYPDITVEEYLTYCAHLRLMQTKDIPAAVERVMKRCDITHFRNRIINNLSGGYQQRVGIAQAIVHNPSFVIFDEPTNGLDPNQIIEIRHLIKEIATDHAVLLSTHILSEVQATCNNIKMIEQGKLVFSGTMDEFNNYVAPSTLLVTFDTPPSVSTLAAIEHVSKVENVVPGHYRIQFDAAHDISEHIVQLSVANDWQLSEIQLERLSLNAIFAQLSGKKIQL